MVTNNKGKFNNADIIGLKIIIMKNIYFIIAIIFLFGCKKEKIEPSEKVDLTGKLKCLILKDNYKQLFKYYFLVCGIYIALNVKVKAFLCIQTQIDLIISIKF